MRLDRRQLILSGLAGVVAFPVWSAEGQALVAVAANFRRVADTLLPKFEHETGFKITLSSGSTGQLYSQILNGAPYDVFLSADQVRPALLEKAGLGHGRMTYARGLLSLWQPEGDVTEASLHGAYKHIAIANPALAPYGLAARQALTALALWEPLQTRIVMGQNVGQAYALVASGNAELGLIAHAYAQAEGAHWAVPKELYSPILQDAILLGDNPAAAAFLAFLGSASTQEDLRAAGYGAI